MSDVPDTIFLRLEGPLQAWGDNSKFVIRRTMEAPTKSGVIGLICCAMGVRRGEASVYPIPERFVAMRDLAFRLNKETEHEEHRPIRTILDVLNTLEMGVRIDRTATRWWDYHTVGAKIGMLTADGKGIKRTGGAKGPIETLISRREYLCDASFLVALRGDAELIQEVARALQGPQWPLYLGRKSCPPAIPILVQRKCGNDNGATDKWEPLMEPHGDLKSALESKSVPWRPRYKNGIPRDEKGKRLDCLIEWRASEEEPTAPPDAEVWYDSPVCFDPPVHEPRLVMRLAGDRQIEAWVGKPLQYHTSPPPRPRADYQNTEFRKRRKERLESDQGLCVFCKSPATTVQHVTYRRAGGNEVPEDLRSLCRLCHDAVTMIEYGLGMGLDRVDPCDPRWRDTIIAKRDEIRRWRSEEGRRRALRQAPERVRREVLEEVEV